MDRDEVMAGLKAARAAWAEIENNDHISTCLDGLIQAVSGLAHEPQVPEPVRQHDWQFYANGTFCRRCGAQIGSGAACH